MRKAALLFAALGACSSWAQQTRDAYRETYRAWRQSDPNLERDAATGGAAVAQRASRMASEAAKYGKARSGFLQWLADDLTQKVLWLEVTAAGAEEAAKSTKGAQDFVASETGLVSRNINTFASDPDPGIQQLRQDLERERAALAALGGAISERQKAVAATGAATAAVEEARLKALEQYRGMVAGLKQVAGQVQRETEGWARYYEKLSEGSRAAATPPPQTAAAPPTNPPRTAGVPARPPSITPVPLSRYTGAWTYPSSNGLYHGPQPEFIDLVVQEQGGHATGILFARFKSPPGSTIDPVLRFNFSGDFKNTRNQVFNLETSDGAKGTIELIPGPAFNLLEVNFQTDPKPGKVRQANVLLVKK